MTSLTTTVQADVEINLKDRIFLVTYMATSDHFGLRDQSYLVRLNYHVLGLRKCIKKCKTLRS